MRLRLALPAATLALLPLAALTAGPAQAATNPSSSAPSSAGARAGASTPPVTVDLTAARATCTADIDLRLAKLGSLGASLTAATAVTAAHRSAQQASLTAATAGLTQLKAKVAADADARTLKADCQTQYTSYRVFALRAPQTGYVIAGDAQVAAVARLQAVTPKLSDALAKLQAAGKDVSGASAALTDLQAKLADAAPRAARIADGVIPFTPADTDADKAVLTPTHTQVLAVGTDLAGARADIKTIAAALKTLAR